MDTLIWYVVGLVVSLAIMLFCLSKKEKAEYAGRQTHAVMASLEYYLFSAVGIFSGLLTLILTVAVIVQIYLIWLSSYQASL